jgi:hypothetical protein
VKRVVLLGVAASTALVAAGWQPAHAAGTAEVTAVAWWSQRLFAEPLPEGGFEVANGLGGAESVAALHVEVDGDVRSARLTVTEAGGVGQDVAPVAVCRTDAQWSPVNPGAWPERPTENCDRRVILTRAEDGTWSGDVGTLLGDGSTSLVLLPDPDPAVPSFFNVQFSGASLAASGGGSVTTTTDAAPPTTSGSSGSPVASPPRGPSPVVPSAPRPQVATTTTVAAPPTTAATGSTPTTAFTPRAVSASAGDGRPWGRLVLYVPICAAIAFAVAYGRSALAAGRLPTLGRRAVEPAPE